MSHTIGRMRKTGIALSSGLDLLKSLSSCLRRRSALDASSPAANTQHNATAPTARFSDRKIEVYGEVQCVLSSFSVLVSAFSSFAVIRSAADTMQWQ